MSLTRLLVPSFTHMLQNLSQWLDKAAARESAAGNDVDGLMAQRLAPDMYPLAAQVRFACFQALEPTYRLRGLAVPQAWLQVRNDGWASNERPGTLAEAQACIAEALAALADLPGDALDGRPEAPIALDLPNGIIFDMDSEQYARDWSFPQFYFHCITAYAILRSLGVELGKADYVAHVLAYVRPGTLPQG